MSHLHGVLLFLGTDYWIVADVRRLYRDERWICLDFPPMLGCAFLNLSQLSQLAKWSW